MRDSWHKSCFKPGGLERIEAAVRVAERLSEGEIVSVLAKQSAPYASAPWLLALGLWAVAQSLGLALWTEHLPWGHWAAQPIEAATCLAIGYACCRFDAFRRVFSLHRDRAHAVEAAAREAFLALNLRGTRGSTGILLYVSLLEHRAVVLADQAIAAKVDPAIWDEVCGLLLKGAHERDLAGGFEAAIARSAQILKPHFPAKKRGRNELKDKLVFWR